MNEAVASYQRNIVYLLRGKFRGWAPMCAQNAQSSFTKGEHTVLRDFNLNPIKEVLSFDLQLKIIFGQFCTMYL